LGRSRAVRCLLGRLGRLSVLIALAARYRLPAVYYERYFVAAGGPMSYGSDNVDAFRFAAGYVDRILKDFRCRGRTSW
jgi:hypothetical protein